MFGSMPHVYNPDCHHRRSIRLKGYDYASPGAYFVTMCVQDGNIGFGDVARCMMTANAIGRMVTEWWHRIPSKFDRAELDVFQVMPDHFHGIIWITSAPVVAVEADRRVRPGDERHVRVGPVVDGGGDDREGTHRGVPLPSLVQWFKTMTTNAYFRGVRRSGWPPVRGRLWQRNYYEHIIRDDDDLDWIRA